MNPANFKGIDDYNVDVVVKNGDGTETKMTVEEWKESHLVVVDVKEMYKDVRDRQNEEY